MATYSPAQAAEVSGFSIDTLRYYEREGILRPIARSSSGHRTYTDADLGWLDLVHCLRDTGMPIADLKRYAELALDEATLAARVALLEEHDRRVQESMDALRRQQERLREKIAWYREQGV
jgi:DNA-binding transcriptional MerR regulator